MIGNSSAALLGISIQLKVSGGNRMSIWHRIREIGLRLFGTTYRIFNLFIVIDFLLQLPFTGLITTTIKTAPHTFKLFLLGDTLSFVLLVWFEPPWRLIAFPFSAVQYIIESFHAL